MAVNNTQETAIGGFSVFAENQNEILVAFCYVGLPVLALLWYLLHRAEHVKPGFRRTTGMALLVAILTVGGALRLWFALTYPGHVGDMNYFREWAVEAHSRALNHFYDGDFHCDYPPVYIYMLRILGAIKDGLDLAVDGPAFAMLLRMPAIVADLLIGFLFWRVASASWNEQSALLLCAFVVLNPASIVNSAIWGQIDSILTLIVLGVIWLIYAKQYIWSAALLMTGFLMKPQCLFVGPVVLYAFIGHLLRAKNRRKAWLELTASLCVAVALWFLVPLPFGVGREPLWLVHLYRNTLGLYPQATLNAFNFYGLIGLNGIDAREVFFGGISAQHWGVIAASTIVGYGAWLYVRCRQRKFLFVLAGFVWAAICTFVHSMHERYAFAAPFLFVAGYLLMDDRRLLDCAALLFGIQLVDECVTLYCYDLVIDMPAPVMDWMSLLSVIVFCYAAWTTTSIALHGAEQPQHAPEAHSVGRRAADKP